MLIGIIPDSIPDPIRNIILQPAFFDGKHLVKGSRDMKSHRIHLVVCHLLLHLLFSEPTLVRKRIFQFVAVEASLFRPHDRAEFRQLHLTDPRQVVKHLLLFVPKLVVIREALPFATSADSEMLTERLCPHGRPFMKFHGDSLGIMVFLALYLQIHHVTRHYIRYKDHQVIYFCQGLALGCHICYGNFLQ